MSGTNAEVRSEFRFPEPTDEKLSVAKRLGIPLAWADVSVEIEAKLSGYKLTEWEKRFVVLMMDFSARGLWMLVGNIYEILALLEVEEEELDKGVQRLLDKGILESAKVSGYKRRFVIDNDFVNRFWNEIAIETTDSLGNAVRRVAAKLQGHRQRDAGDSH
jgi:hypothetical protein